MNAEQIRTCPPCSSRKDKPAVITSEREYFEARSQLCWACEMERVKIPDIVFLRLYNVKKEVFYRKGCYGRSGAIGKVWYGFGNLKKHLNLRTDIKEGSTNPSDLAVVDATNRLILCYVSDFKKFQKNS